MYTKMYFLVTPSKILKRVFIMIMFTQGVHSFMPSQRILHKCFQNDVRMIKYDDNMNRRRIQ